VDKVMRCKFYFTRAMSNPIWVWLAALLFIQPGRAEPPRVGEFRLFVQVLRQDSDGEQLQVERRPQNNVFVYAPNTRIAGVLRILSATPRLGFKEWLVAVAEQTRETKKEHVFSITNGKVVPSRVAGRTTDTWTVPKDSDNGLFIRGSANSPWAGTSATLVSQTLKHPEPFPIDILPLTVDAEQAYALVLDHPVARITDDSGIAVFDRLPVGVDVPLLVRAPGITSMTLLEEVEGVEIKRGGLVVYAKEQKVVSISLLVKVKTSQE